MYATFSPFQRLAALPANRALGNIAGLLITAWAMLHAAWSHAQAPAQAPTAPPAKFDLSNVSAIAQERAGQPWVANSDSRGKPVTPLPQALRDITYDQLRDVRFKTDQSLWRDASLPFETQFFHLGLYQTEPVVMNEITPDGVRHIAYSGSLFDYGKNTFDTQAWGDLGFAGLRLHYPLNTAAYKDELAVFQGASYFRALGAGQGWGLSARGLAIDTVGGAGEEFPRFTEFWLQRPAAGETQVTVFALLDSPRATGAYRFDITPGAQTVMRVTARVFLRSNTPAGQPSVATLGLAPLTSMFLFGENQPSKTDFRPEVHDSDGLMVETGEGEWLWRPLQNPGQTTTTSFTTTNPRGFGLMQRDRKFASYEDTEARYERRPSAWVRPLGNWGAGRVELVMLHAPDETYDNVVAYWVPAQLPAPGTPLDFSYELAWQGDNTQQPPGSRVVQSRRGIGFHKLDADALKSQVQFVVDFAGPALDALPADATVQATVTADANGRVIESNTYRNAASGTWRVALRVQRLDASRPVELRAFLQNRNDIVSETWTNIILPE